MKKKLKTQSKLPYWLTKITKMEAFSWGQFKNSEYINLLKKTNKYQRIEFKNLKVR